LGVGRAEVVAAARARVVERVLLGRRLVLRPGRYGEERERDGEEAGEDASHGREASSRGPDPGAGPDRAGWDGAVAGGVPDEVGPSARRRHTSLGTVPRPGVRAR